MLKRNKRRTGRQSLTPSAASVVPLGDDRLPTGSRSVGLAVASASRAEGKVAGAEPRDADAGALRLIASTRAELKITEQAADAADPQTSAAGLTDPAASAPPPVADAMATPSAATINCRWRWLRMAVRIFTLPRPRCSADAWTWRSLGHPGMWACEGGRGFVDRAGRTFCRIPTGQQAAASQ